MSPRAIHASYEDPLWLIWADAAARLGLRLPQGGADNARAAAGVCSSGLAPVPAPSGGALAGSILHALCHALLTGAQPRPPGEVCASRGEEAALLQEHAVQRVQAALSDRHGLRALFDVGGEHAGYWNMLGVDAMRCGPGDPAIPLAREGLARAEEPPWSEVLQRALEDTASLAALVRPGAPEGSPWASTRPLNAVGYPCLETTPGKRCGQCAWLYDASDGGTPRCRHSEDALHPLGLSSDVDEPACNRFEPTMDEESCGLCGACCREAFHRVEVEPGERFARAHRSLLVADEHGLHLPRPGGRCPPLRGGGVEGPYRCGLYGDRPCSCADFEVAGAACLEARVRIGLGP